MSGGVGPSDDILLKEDSNHNHHQPQPPPPQTHLHRHIFSFHQLNALAVAIVLSFTGMVAVEDIAFVILSFFYMFFMSKFAFPALSPSHHHPVLHHRLFSLYASLGTLIGLYIPTAYILEGILEGDKAGIKAATPHVFLLASQLFLEGVAVSGGFSSAMRTLIMVVYNGSRMFSLVEWMRVEMVKVGGYAGEFVGSERRLLVGRVLAVVNMVYWGFNLFGFLLPVYMPKAFERYYSEVKNVED